MGNEIQIEGYLGSKEIVLPQEKRVPNANPTTKQTISHVQITNHYPKTGETASHYLVFTGFCLLLIVMIVCRKETE